MVKIWIRWHFQYKIWSGRMEYIFSYYFFNRSRTKIKNCHFSEKVTLRAKENGRERIGPVCKRKDSVDPRRARHRVSSVLRQQECAAGDVWCESTGGGTASPCTSHGSRSPPAGRNASSQAGRHTWLHEASGTPAGRQFRFRFIADVIREKKAPAEIKALSLFSSGFFFEFRYCSIFCFYLTNIIQS